MNGARLTVDLDAIARNHALLAALAGPAEVAPVLKADGYGLGAGPVARRLWREGARTFFVVRLGEGQALRQALGPERAAAILVLDGLAGGEPGPFARAQLTPVLNTPADMHAWRGTGLPAALHADTGMNRLGVDAADLAACRDLDIVHVMSHLACAADAASPRNARQLELFGAARAVFPSATASLAASAGVFLGAAYHFDLVRPGISMFGGGPLERPDPRIAAVATLEAPILQIRDLKAGDSVGYGDGFTAGQAMRIALLGAGYADGVMRRSKGGARGWLSGRPVPLLTVSMDLIAADVGAVPNARPGDMVELLGDHALLDDLAAAAGTVAHECLVRLSARAERRYLGQDAPQDAP